MPYDPRVTLPPVTQFPQQPLMDPLTAQMMQRRFGGAPQGLLDRSNAPAGLLGPSTVAPDILRRGLLTPVIWDRLQRGINPMRTTEGAVENYAGGGRGGGQLALGLEGGSGSVVPGYRPPRAPGAEPEFKLDWRTYGRDQTVHRAITKSGVRVVMAKDQYGAPGTVDVLFDAPEGVVRGSTKRGIGRFEEVYSAVKDYVQGFRPERLRFSGLTDKHDKLYERIAPRMAKDLGGELIMPSRPGGNFVINLQGNE